jgi:hypothetical protein
MSKSRRKNKKGAKTDKYKPKTNQQNVHHISTKDNFVNAIKLSLICGEIT